MRSITPLVEGLKTEEVSNVKVLPSVLALSTAVFNADSTLLQFDASSPLTGLLKRAESYNDNTDACARAVVPELKNPLSPGSTLMGRPSRVLIKTDAKSWPST